MGQIKGQTLGLSLFVAVCTATPADADTIVIKGKRRERTRIERAGVSSLMTPSELTRFSTKELLKTESAVSLPETGRVAPSGFVVPRIRGQDARLTEVYLENTLLVDPYSGLPLLEDLDVRAFGAMEIHQGLSPYDVPSTSGVGAVRYRDVRMNDEHHETGVEGGKPFGVAAWGSTQWNPDQVGVGLYGRAHQTNGAFEYYDDNGTPYNDLDDRVLVRRNNDQKSTQLVPRFTTKIGRHTLKLRDWWSRSERGLAGLGGRGCACIREAATTNLFQATLTNDTVTTALTHRTDLRRTADPAGEILAGPGAAKISTASTAGEVNISTSNAPWQGSSSVHVSSADVRSSTDRYITPVALSRRQLNLYTGHQVGVTSNVMIEGKLRGLYIQDQFSSRPRFDTVGEALAPSVERLAGGGGIGARIHYGPGALYAQGSRQKRPPSLIEEFGDGSYIWGNPDLAPETETHLETGAYVFFFARKLRLGSALFQDRVTDKIVFTVAQGNSVRAANVRAATIRGLELASEGTLARTKVGVSATLYDGSDETAKTKRPLPGIPKWTGLFSLEQKIAGGFTGRWLTRHRDQIFRDVAATIAVPAATIHDVSLDWSEENGHWQVGASIFNVFDVKKLPIYVPQVTANRGSTAYSEVTGFPLPGRQWQVGVSASL